MPAIFIAPWPVQEQIANRRDFQSRKLRLAFQSYAVKPLYGAGELELCSGRHKYASIEIGKLTIFNESESELAELFRSPGTAVRTEPRFERCEAPPPRGLCQKCVSFVLVFHSV